VNLTGGGSDPAGGHRDAELLRQLELTLDLRAIRAGAQQSLRSESGIRARTCDQGDLRRAAGDLQVLETSRPSEEFRDSAALVPYLRSELALSRGKWDEAAAQAGAAREVQQLFTGELRSPALA
jgi:hypothetical protein